jgi:chaperonin cofactor prefoldin
MDFGGKVADWFGDLERRLARLESFPVLTERESLIETRLKNLETKTRSQEDRFSTHINGLRNRMERVECKLDELTNSLRVTDKVTETHTECLEQHDRKISDSFIAVLNRLDKTDSRLAQDSREVSVLKFRLEELETAVKELVKTDDGRLVVVNPALQRWMETPSVLEGSRELDGRIKLQLAQRDVELLNMIEDSTREGLDSLVSRMVAYCLKPKFTDRGYWER